MRIKLSSNSWLYCTYYPNIPNNIPTEAIDPVKLKLPDIELADPRFMKPQRIDIIIGASIFYELLCNEQQRPISDGPICQKTHFGWLVFGNIPNTVTEATNVALFSSIENLTIIEEINRFNILKNQKIKILAYWRMHSKWSIFTWWKNMQNYFENTVIQSFDINLS